MYTGTCICMYVGMWLTVSLCFSLRHMYVCCWFRRKMSQPSDPEGGSNEFDGKRSMSQDTSNSWDRDSRSELVTFGVEQSSSAADVVVCAPPVPKREPTGELVVPLTPCLSLDPTSGQSTGQCCVDSGGPYTCHVCVQLVACPASGSGLC